MKPSSGKALKSAHDFLGHAEHPLDPFFRPKNIAVIGATENPGSVGRTTLWNLISTPFGGAVFPVNPKRDSVLGIKAYKSVKEIPAEVDLAVIVTQSKLIPGLVAECGEIGVKSAVVISAGFKEAGPEGKELERQLLVNARAAGIRIIGPNCLGIMVPPSGVNATFAAGMARTGSVGFLSQSGALCTAVLDWSLKEQVGFSAFMSLGSMSDVGWGDLIYYLGNDPKTRSILIYMESVGDARSFLSAAREVAYTKPIIVIKAGRTAAGSKAAASHTGSMTGSDDVLDVAFQRSGVLRVKNISDLFYMAEVLAKQPRPKGPRLTILTNAGGPGVLAADSLLLGGGELAEISQQTISELNEFLPASWSHSNPIDVIGDAGPERYAKSLEVAAKDPNSDGLLVVLTPQAMTDSTQTAQLLKPYAKLGDKPVIASWMGGVDVAAGEQILNQAGIPTFPYPDTAARMFNYMWRYASNLKALYETPSYAKDGGSVDSAAANAIIQRVRGEGRTILTEFESKDILAAYGIPTLPSRIASTEDQAVDAAESMGYPVVLKLHSLTITHKTDVGGVQLNLKTADAVRGAFRSIRDSVAAKVGLEHFNGVNVQPFAKLDGYEVILGSSIDPQFGPVLLFGMGGQLVEVFKDRALALPPLNSTLARRMMERTKIYTALKGVRGRAPVDLPGLEQLLVAFSRLVVEQPWIKELDINPLMASPERLLALDARVVLHDPDTKEEDLPKPAIRPYPVQYAGQWTMPNGETVAIRPIRPEDEPEMVKFHESLSERTVYQRYLQLLNLSQRTAHDRLTRICYIDYARQMALAVERTDPKTGEARIIGVGRLQGLIDVPEAEFSIVISDDFQKLGLGSELLSRLIAIGKAEGVKVITADILAENSAMQKISERAGFKLKRDTGEPVVGARLEL
ncbi:bifunctional acetate--CoA ligase family protein/GNAT family N-acetyltransferase [Paludibaculum fermentans]|uniref:Bifunctional acetate--CoA ligase family protein/GNAT family N-acetyltransferase n=1 Tax=Paludibaculum fermentans TaxID=1473598 RepID=A0A7S7NN93_PALFE|nr:bifunctional acetate--CoA ligase family protein/GNAT family N-acetyltransferase [Paludibaculum fermentans]QOY86674.1 bifunctional acetate--CoA ligase family protein/GNAT family N-acetyltransferase [Paludibaculum fermentans]